MSEKYAYIQGNKLKLAVLDSLIMIQRSSTHIFRHTDQLMGAFFQPIMFLVLFSAVYSGAIRTGSDDTYTNFLMAGLIVQTLAFGSTATALAVASDLKKGIVDRFKSLPMSNIAILNGHVVSDVFRNMISATVLIVAGFAIGFRPNADALDWLILIGLTVLLTLAFSWLAAILGIVAKSVEGVQWMTFVIVFPLTFASSAFVRPETMTSWLRGFAENQPITHIVDTYRALLIGTPLGDSLWISVVSLIGLVLVSMPVAAWLFKNKQTSN